MRSRRFLYLSGLGTGTASVKGKALARALESVGVRLELVDLRVPSFAEMRIEAMLARVGEVAGDASSVVLLGTSLGGFVANCYASLDRRVAAQVLFAPVLHGHHFRAHHRALAVLWRQLGWLPVFDKTERRLRRVGAGLLRELEAMADRTFEHAVPTLIAHGRSDRLVPVTVSRDFARARSHVRLVELEGGHTLRSSLPFAVEEALRFVRPWLIER